MEDSPMRSFVLGSFLLSLLSGPSFGADLFVDQNAPNCNAGTGTAGDPVCTVAGALALASAGDTIHIAPGTYLENLVIGIDVTLVGTQGQDVTFLDGGAAVAQRVVRVAAATTIAIDGVTIRNGTTIGQSGGGVAVDGTLLLTNSTIRNNTTNRYGGGVYGSPGSDIVIDNCLFEQNSSNAGNSYAARGGGVFSRDGDLSVMGSILTDNRASMYVKATCSFPIGRGGGGLGFRSNGTLLIANSTISNNRASCDGGGLTILPGSTTATPEPATIINTTISGNMAAYGAGMVATRFDFQNVTMTANLAASSYYGYNYSYSGHGGGINAYGDAADHVVHNSILAGNESLSSGSSTIPADLRGSFLSAGYNLIGTEGLASGFVNGVMGDQVGTDLNPIDPELGELRNNGGPTHTHAPRVGSPVIDAGDPVSFQALDQRGMPRPIGLRSDIGAVEFELRDATFCNGDGGDQMGCTNCPCGNNAVAGTTGGCLNSSGTSCSLLASGSTSVSLPAGVTTDLRFALTGAAGATLCVLLSGSQLAPENPANPCFVQQSGVRSIAFDGLRCAILNIRRHGARNSDTNGAVGTTNQPWGGEGAPMLGIAQAFGGFMAGETRYFQTIYRDVPTGGCGRGLNTTQAVEIVFTP